VFVSFISCYLTEFTQFFFSKYRRNTVDWFYYGFTTIYVTIYTGVFKHVYETDAPVVHRCLHTPMNNKQYKTVQTKTVERKFSPFVFCVSTKCRALLVTQIHQNCIPTTSKRPANCQGNTERNNHIGSKKQRISSTCGSRINLCNNKADTPELSASEESRNYYCYYASDWLNG